MKRTSRGAGKIEGEKKTGRAGGRRRGERHKCHSTDGIPRLWKTMHGCQSSQSSGPNWLSAVAIATVPTVSCGSPCQRSLVQRCVSSLCVWERRGDNPSLWPHTSAPPGISHNYSRQTSWRCCHFFVFVFKFCRATLMLCTKLAVLCWIPPLQLWWLTAVWGDAIDF